MTSAVGADRVRAPAAPPPMAADPGRGPRRRSPRPILAPLGTAARWAAVGFAGLVCVMMLWWPLGHDQGIFASNGDVILNGGAPYRDAWELRGPLAFYMTAAIQLVFGRNAWGVRVVDVGIALLTAWLLRGRLRTLTSAAAALTGAALWPVFVASLTYDESAQFDLWVGTAMLAGTLLVTRVGGYRRRDLAAAGALVGLASLTKPFYPAFLAVPAVVVLLRRRGAADAAPDIGWLVLGWLAPIVPTVGWLWWEGVAREAWEAHIMYGLRVYTPTTAYSAFPAESSNAVRLRGLLEFVSHTKIALLLAPMSAGAAVLWRRRRALAAATLTWVLVGVGFVLLQNKFWKYHWGPIYPAFVFLAVVGVHGAAAESRRSETRAAAVFALVTSAMFAGALAFGPLVDLGSWLGYVAGRQSAAAYYSTFLRYGQADPAEEQAVAAYLRAHTPPGAPFAHWSIHGGLPFLAGRPNATRLHVKRVLTGPLTAVSREHRTEYLEAIRSRRPTYIVVSERGDLRGVTSSRDLLEREFPELAALVAERYAVEARIGMVDLYRLRVAPPGR